MRWIKRLLAFLWGPEWDFTLCTYHDHEDYRSGIGAERRTVRARGFSYYEADRSARIVVRTRYDEIPGRVYSAKKVPAP